MDFGSIVSYVEAQPWSVAVPFAAAVLVDWAIGSFEAFRAGEFKKESVFDWVKTTVGYSKAAAIVSTVAMAYFLNGKAAAYVALTPLVAVGGAAFLVVLADLKTKIAALPGAIFPKAPAAK